MFVFFKIILKFLIEEGIELRINRKKKIYIRSNKIYFLDDEFFLGEILRDKDFLWIMNLMGKFFFLRGGFVKIFYINWGKNKNIFRDIDLFSKYIVIKLFFLFIFFLLVFKM